MTDLIPNTIIQGDIRTIARQLPAQSVQCIVTSPPYWGLRDYGHPDQIGHEPTPEAYVQTMVDIFGELRRVLRDDGTLWLNLGDTYASSTKGSGGPSKKQLSNAGSRYEMSQRLITGLTSKNLLGIPWRTALALQADGWILRSDIIWHKPNGMPESVTNRPTKSHEYIFLFSKSTQYYYDYEAIKEPAVDTGGGPFSDKYAEAQPAHGGKSRYRSKRDSFKRSGSKREPAILGQNYGTHRPDREESEYDTTTRNKRSVWTVNTEPCQDAHFAVFPSALIEPCILAGCPPNGIVLDPFFGSGTVGEVCVKTGRNWLGVELNPDYIKIANKRVAGTQPALFAPDGTVLNGHKQLSFNIEQEAAARTQKQ